MFSLKTTVLIILALIIPFLLKTIGLEPFPAVQLPAWGITVKEINGQIKLDYSVLFGLDSAGYWKEIDQKKLVHPIPVHYSSYIINSNFGKDKAALRSTSRRYKILKRTPYFKKYYHTFLNRQKLDSIDLIERKLWLQERLKGQGLRTTYLKVAVYTKIVSTKSKKTTANILKHEKLIELSE
jgi:hypothetical protein